MGMIMRKDSGGYKAIFITMRTGSARLPGKGLLPLNDSTRVIDFLIKRVKRCKEVDLIVLCTTTLVVDDILEQVAKKHRICIYRGSVEDKLGRWLQAAFKNQVDFFVTVDGDDLYCDPWLIDLAIRQYKRKVCKFIATDKVPCGAFSWGIQTAALKKIYDKHPNHSNTEMGNVWFKEITELSPIPFQYRGSFRLTLDYPEDYKFFKILVNELGDVSIPEVNLYLKKHPEIVKINSFRQEDFLVNQNKAKKELLNG